MWTKAQVRQFQAGLAEAKKHEDAIERLTQLGKLNPALAERVQQLRDMRDHLEQTCATALAIDPDGE